MASSSAVPDCIVSIGPSAVSRSAGGAASVISARGSLPKQCARSSSTPSLTWARGGFLRSATTRTPPAGVFAKGLAWPTRERCGASARIPTGPGVTCASMRSRADLRISLLAQLVEQDQQQGGAEGAPQGGFVHQRPHALAPQGESREPAPFAAQLTLQVTFEGGPFFFAPHSHFAGQMNRWHFSTPSIPVRRCTYAADEVSDANHFMSVEFSAWRARRPHVFAGAAGAYRDGSGMNSVSPGTGGN